MPQQIREADVDSVIFCYQVGLTYTAIWTKPKDQWTAAIPDHLKMSFGFSTPSNFYGSGEVLREIRSPMSSGGKLERRRNGRKSAVFIFQWRSRHGESEKHGGKNMLNEIITLDNPDRAQVKTEWIGDRLRITWHKDQELLHAITLSPEDAGLLSAVIQVALRERIVGIPTAEVSR